MLALSTKAPALTPPDYPVQAGPLTVERLPSGCKGEVLAFLAARPIHTVILAGMIRDNGLVSELNRGAFYACRDSAGNLEGIALIGHVTMVETNNEQALQLFAQLAQKHQHAHLILGEQEKAEQFWQFYRPAGQSMRLICRELLLEQRWPVEVHDSVNLRRATLAEIDQVTPVHAQMAFDECGINPLETDPDGFRKRIARRIEQGRVWVWMDESRLIFKADVVSDTPEAIYIEGVYLSPRDRGKGFGVRSMSQLACNLLPNTKSLCLLVNEQHQPAQECYYRAGYKLRSSYDTIYLQQ